ncbi:MAG: hypothetical protein QW491_09915 [Thermoproteota archaeon]
MVFVVGSGNIAGVIQRILAVESDQEDLRCLKELEHEALQRGIKPEELAKLRAIGDCPSQVILRVLKLKDWLSKSAAEQLCITH